MSKNTITVRFDDVGRQIALNNRTQTNRDNNDETESPALPVSIEPISVMQTSASNLQLNQYTSDFGSWESPFGRTEINKDHLDAVFHHLEDQPLRMDTVRREVTYQKRSSGAAWARIVTSVAGAVVTGAVFGLFVLSQFSKDSNAALKQSDNSLPAIASPSAAKNNLSTGLDASDKSKDQNLLSQPTLASPSQAATSTGTVLAVAIPARSYAFLQHGVFATPKAALSAEDVLKKKGLSYVAEQGDKTYVYVGFAASKDEAQALSGQIAGKKVEVYIKNLELPAISKVKGVKAPASSLNDWFDRGSKLITMMNATVLVHLDEVSPTGLDDTTTAAIADAKNGWTAAATTVSSGLPAAAQPLTAKMKVGLETAVTALQNYNKSPSMSKLLEAQSGMMTYILAEKELRSVLSA
jgi:stage II sporulation protein B